MVSTRRSGGPVAPVELSFNGKDLKKVIPIAEQRRLQEEESSLSEDLLLEKEDLNDEGSEAVSDDKEEVVEQKTQTTRRTTRYTRAKAKPITHRSGRRTTKLSHSKPAPPNKSTLKTARTKSTTAKATRTTKTKSTNKRDTEVELKKNTEVAVKKNTEATKKKETATTDENIPLLVKKETRGRPRKYPLGPNGKPIMPPPALKPGEVKKKRGRPRKLETILGEKRKLADEVTGSSAKKLKADTSPQGSDSVSPDDESPREKIPSMEGATIQPISAVVPPQHATTSPNIHKHNINHLLSNDAPPASAYPQTTYDTRTPNIPSSAPYPHQIPPPSSSSYNSGYSPRYQPYPGQQPPPPPPPYPQQLPPYPYQQYSHTLHPPYPLTNGPMPNQGPAPMSQSHISPGPQPPPPPPPRRQQPLPPGPSSQEPHGRIPITSIISQKIDTKDLPSIMYEGDTTREEANEDAEGAGEREDEDDGELNMKQIKRRYRVDRENIKINKRIMSQDTEDVIKMFKKFDDEVLSHPEARKRLLLLGFETRKRYITTFKHYIRFCCRKKMDNFFVTGDLMKEFYQEQFALSTSSKPVIRLRKMDPAFSKLQEINNLVYRLGSKEIPRRHIALEYLVYKEMGKEPENDDNSAIDVIGKYNSEVIKGKRKRRTFRKDKHDEFAISIYAPEKGRRPNHGTDGGNQTLLVHPSLPPLPSLVRENQEKMQRQREWEEQNQRLQEAQDRTHGSEQHHTPDLAAAASKLQHVPSQSTSPPALIYPKKITKKNIEEIRRSFAQLCTEINSSLQKAMGVEPAFVSDLTTKVNALLDKFDLELNGPRPPQPPPPQTTSTGVPIYDLQPNTYTVYEILDEWYNGTPGKPSVAQRLEQYGEEWIRDEFEYNTFVERRSVVEFVERLSKETKVDIWVIANDCDKYIRDKSILDEFISEIELDVEDLFKRILRYRQRRG